MAEEIDTTPATVSVIGRGELDRTLSRDLRDAVRYEPGVSIENGPARFGLGNVAIRGLDGNRVVLLQDGIRLPDNFRVGSFSNANRNPFDLGLLSRVEILRGPGSALYGSDALAGVLSMTTLDPRDVVSPGAAQGARVDAGYAQADRSVWATGSGAMRTPDVELLLAGSRAQGHERENQGTNDITGTARTTPNPQDTHAESVLAKLVVPTRDGGRWRFTYDNYDRRVETDVLSLNPQSVKTVSLRADDRSERRRASVDAEILGLGFIDRLSLLLYRQDSTTEQDTTEVRANTTAACLSANGTVRCKREAQFRFAQEDTGFTVIGDAASGIHRAVFGAELSRVETDERRDGLQTNLDTGSVTNIVGTDIFPTRDFPKSRVDRYGLFVQDEISLSRATLVPALRYDRFEMKPEVDELYRASNPGRAVTALSDDAWSPKLGALVPIGPAATLSVQLAAGFRAPPYSDANVGLSNLPLGYAVIANPDLEPERSRGIEVGVRGRTPRASYSATAYRTDYHDLIVSRAPLPCPGDPRCVPGAPTTFQSQNVTRARIEGVELRGDAIVHPGWTLRGAYAWSRGDDLSKGVPLNAVEPPKLVAGLSWEPSKIGGVELIVTHAAAKTRIDNSAGTLTATPAYTVSDLLAHVSLGRNVTLHVGVFNVFDRKYWLWTDVKGVLNSGTTFDRYTQPGRNASVSIKVQL